MCRREIPPEFLDHPHLVYKIQESTATTEDGYQWFYEGRNGMYLISKLHSLFMKKKKVFMAQFHIAAKNLT